MALTFWTVSNCAAAGASLRRMIDGSFFLLSWKVCKAAISAACISDFKCFYFIKLTGGVCRSIPSIYGPLSEMRIEDKVAC